MDNINKNANGQVITLYITNIYYKLSAYIQIAIMYH